jgi:hypothetical protein
MATYFQAIRAVKVFREYKRLTLAYWAAQPEPSKYAWMAGDVPASENEESQRIREQIISMYPEASICANQIAVPVTSQSFPPVMRGGPAIPINVLYGAFDRRQGYGEMAQQDILDGINRCLAQAETFKKLLFRKQFINPIWWVTEAIAYVLRIPFVILRKAGVPANVEESIWGHIVKILVFITMTLIGLHYGLNISAKDILGWVK